MFVGFKDFLGESIVVLGNIRKLKLLISMVWFIGFLFFGLFFFKDMVVYLIFNSFWLGFNLVKFLGGLGKVDIFIRYFYGFFLFLLVFGRRK